jgi:DNA-binding LytR/AlgR family response regulator
MNGIEAYSYIKKLGYDILTVIVTANSKEVESTDLYGLEGIVDIIPKLFLHQDSWRLDKTLEKLQDKLFYRNFMKSGGVFIPIVTKHSIDMIPLNEVIYIQSSLRKISVFTELKEYPTDITITAYWDFLMRTTKFIKVSRSCIVNTEKVTFFDGSSLYILGQQQHKIKVSNDYIHEISKWMVIKNNS